MKQDQLVAHRGAAPMNDYVFQLTDIGRELPDSAKNLANTTRELSDTAKNPVSNDGETVNWARDCSLPANGGPPGTRSRPSGPQPPYLPRSCQDFPSVWAAGA